MDGVIENDMPTSKQESEAVREKIRQLENRQKILLNRKADAERKARTHRLIERGARWNRLCWKSCGNCSGSFHRMKSGLCAL
ncbi:DUF3847 domain-containing protein [Caproicibacter sp.]|uniref:DUF3847 domain-containing protein n=1 Tax=Caproicibacter sp. TaxID=2814884 RepID=UPI003989A248